MNDEEDTIILHVLTNDIADICQQYYKSDALERALVVLARKVCAICSKIINENLRSHLYIPMIPLRYDSKDQIRTDDDMEIVNFEIDFRLGKKNLRHTHHWKCQLAKNKELSIPPI